MRWEQTASPRGLASPRVSADIAAGNSRSSPAAREPRRTAYGDVAAAAAAPKGPQALGTWLATNEIDVPPLLYRVIRSGGTVSAQDLSVDWPGLPDDPRAVETKLRSEGARSDHRRRAAQSQRWRADDWRRTRLVAEP